MITPCGDPANDPNDWFINPAGKQYPDDEFLSKAEVRAISLSVLVKPGESSEDHEGRVNAALGAAVRDRRRRALQARRHAKEACQECPIILECLQQALEEPTPATHGTWGGYYEEELRDIRIEKSRRRRRRPAFAQP